MRNDIDIRNEYYYNKYNFSENENLLRKCLVPWYNIL